MINYEYNGNTLYLFFIKNLWRYSISKTLTICIIYYNKNSIKLFVIYRTKSNYLYLSIVDILIKLLGTFLKSVKQYKLNIQNFLFSIT